MSAANEGYKNFYFSNPSQTEFLKDKKKVREFWYNTLKSIAPKSCFVELMEGKRKSYQEKIKFVLPLGVKQKSDLFTTNPDISQEENIIQFTKSLSLKLTSREKKSIFQSTEVGLLFTKIKFF